ncbi:MAG: flavin reductase family protein [Sulfurovum sp.]|nr:flavin reductase family protein [Sulfurovum sp.]
MMRFDLTQDSSVNETYKLMAQTIIPRPIAWVVTEDEGVVNVAPFSYFIGLSSEPASVLVSIGHKPDGSPKDTLLNLRKHKKCTICMVQESDLEKMHLSSKGLAHSESEAEVFDIETATMKEGFPPLITSAPVAYFCELNQEIDLGGQTVPVVLNVKEIFVDDACVTDKEKLTITFAPVARIGKSYAFLGEEITPPAIP